MKNDIDIDVLSRMANKLGEQAEFYSCEGGGYEAITQQTLDVKCLLTPGQNHSAYICGAFSLQMVPDEAFITKVPCDLDEVPADAISCIGHADTATVISSILGRKVEMNRIQVTMDPGDVAYVFQVQGRLPEGSTTLPDGIGMKLFKVVVR